ncbi:MAG: YkgJ family cysteine cluster protein [Sphingobacteriales bacterium]|uniref:YkgJ family cysteine cluster protein n=1 Tax=Hydrotalea flava TaxID=714549 RepID=UPI00083598CD|nr:YkgJ family cysteine cluster protein [Hydrotalea flava]RTL56649.1 MAG: YkgJ family cysteine cluster protein [Sphingobacteriales bacterium]
MAFLKAQTPQLVDDKVQQLNNEISPQIDCKACGNCCKSLMINVSEEEASHVAAHLKLQRNDFDAQYIEKGSSATLLMNSIPCPFLKITQCSIYEHRFQGCREFPGLHVPGFNDRTFTTFMHYDRCPIIFNVVEHLKVALDFI